MQKNMGGTDRMLRIILAVVFAILYFTGPVTGTVVIFLLLLGGILLLTGVVSFCPLYVLLGIRTCRKD